VNGDGHGDLLVGFTAGDGRGAFVNGARLYSGVSLVPLYRFEGAFDDTATVSLAGLGDADGDGLSEVLVGALGHYRKLKADWDGMVRCYRGAALYTAPTPRAPLAGDTIAIATAQGPAASPTATVVVAIDGNPTYLIVGGVGALDATGQRVLAGAVPAGLAGHTMAIQSLAIDATGHIVMSATEEVTFQ
jgi:hypothetical protein